MWQNSMKKGVLLSLVLLLTAALVLGCGKEEEQGEEQGKRTSNDLGMEDTATVAKYKNGEVTAGEFQQYLNFLSFFTSNSNKIEPTEWSNVLNSYIGQKILVARAKESGIKVNEEEVDSIYQFRKEEITKTLGKEKKYEDHLKSLNLSEGVIKEYIAQYNLINQYFVKNITEEELEKIYKDSIDDYTIASVRHILIRTEKRSDEEAKKIATELAERIRNGEDFAKLANEKSEDEGNVNQDGTKNGGLYEDVPVANWVEEFKKAALELPLNEVSDPVKTAYGYHVMKVEKREVLPLEKVKENIVAQESYSRYFRFMSDELPGLVEEIHLPEQKSEK